MVEKSTKASDTEVADTKAAEPQVAAQTAPTSVQSAGQTSMGCSVLASGSVPAAETGDLAATEGAAQKRALELNVEGRQGQRHPDTPAGQHATGSFTGDPDESGEDKPKDH